MSLISNQYMKALLKTVYLSGVDNLKYQNSPVLSSITKEKWDSMPFNGSCPTPEQLTEYIVKILTETQES